MKKLKEILKKRICHIEVEIPLKDFLLILLMCVCIVMISKIGYINTQEASMEIRIQEISDNLAYYSKELIEIEEELEKRIEYVEHLKEEASEAEIIKDMNQEEIEVMHSIFGQEFTKSNKQSFWQNIALNISFMIVGLIIPKDIVLRLRNKKK